MKGIGWVLCAVAALWIVSAEAAPRDRAGAPPAGAMPGAVGARDSAPERDRDGRGERRSERRGPRERVARMIERLGLTNAQREKFAAIRDARAREAIRTRADIRIAELDLRQMMRAGQPDRGAIEAQVDRIAAMRAGIAKRRIESMLDLRALLTPAQLKIWRDEASRAPLSDRDDEGAGD